MSTLHRDDRSGGRRQTRAAAALTAAAAVGAAVLLAWAGSPAARAEAAVAEGELYTVQPGASRVTFYAHATGHDFSGTSMDVRGSVRLDPVRVASASGEVRVKASTLDTGIDRRNRNMWELLESDTHPDIVFTLERVDVDSGAQTRPGGASGQAGGGPATAASGPAAALAGGASLPSKAALAGSLEVRGVRKPLSVPVELEPSGDAIVVRGGFPLDVRDFGIEPPRAALIIRMQPGVRVELEVRFQKVE